MTDAVRKIPLPEQQAKLNRILDERVAHYRRGVRKGSLALDTAAMKHAEVEAIRASFAFLVDNADWIRAEHRRRIEAQRRADARAAEMAEMSRHPAVAAVLDLPGSEIADIRDLESEQ